MAEKHEIVRNENVLRNFGRSIFDEICEKHLNKISFNGAIKYLLTSDPDNHLIK